MFRDYMVSIASSSLIGLTRWEFSWYKAMEVRHEMKYFYISEPFTLSLECGFLKKKKSSLNFLEKTYFKVTSRRNFLYSIPSFSLFSMLVKKGCIYITWGFETWDASILPPFLLILNIWLLGFFLLLTSCEWWSGLHQALMIFNLLN